MTSMRILGGTAIAALMMTWSFAATAQGIKIGVVNFGRLLDEAPQAQASQRALQEEFAPRQRELREREERLKTLEERLQQGEGFMGEEERRDVEREYRDLQREFNRSKTEFAEDLSLRRNEELGSLQRMLVSEVQTYSRAEAYDIIVSEAVGVVYASSTVDITEKILEALQARHQAGQSSN